jgi:hypothetical protein
LTLENLKDYYEKLKKKPRFIVKVKNQSEFEKKDHLD